MIDHVSLFHLAQFLLDPSDVFFQPRCSKIARFLPESGSGNSSDLHDRYRYWAEYTWLVFSFLCVLNKSGATSTCTNPPKENQL